MEPQEKLTTQQFIIDRLHDIQRKAESNKYSDALTSIKELKVTDAKNIYIIAIEKQISKLNDSSLQPENRTELIKSLPSMIDRAISDIQRKASIPKADEAQKEQKEAALEKLKSQYFQRADDYVEKKDYQRALEEIRRIYIIEPGSVVAKEYEQKIEQLASLQVRTESAPPAVEAEEPVSSVPAADTYKENVVLEDEPKKSKLPIFIGATIIIIGVIVWFVFMRGHSSSQSTQPNQQNQTTTQENLTPQTNQQPAQPQPTEPIAASNPPEHSTEKVAPPEKGPQKPSAKTKKPEAEAKPITAAQPVKAPKPTPTKQPTVAQPTPAPTPPVAEKPKEAESAPIVPFVAIQETPKVIQRKNPEYPAMAQKFGIEGRVVVEVTVDAQGRPIQANVVESTSDIFDDSATEAAMKTTYKPAVMSTGPITAKVRVTFDFHLNR